MDWEFFPITVGEPPEVEDIIPTPEVDVSYAPDKSFVFEDGEWKWALTPDVNGGGRYKNNILVITFDTNGVGKLLWG
jgi:hypothetical protein